MQTYPNSPSSKQVSTNSSSSLTLSKPTNSKSIRTIRLGQNKVMKKSMCFQTWLITENHAVSMHVVSCLKHLWPKVEIIGLGLAPVWG